MEDDGHYVLGARYYSLNDGELCKDRIHVPRELSRCYGAILGEATDVVVQDIEPGKNPFQTPDKASQYEACILHAPDGKRVGVVCSIVDDQNGIDQEERSA